MTSTLNVEKDELLSRAYELEQSMPAPPPHNPVAPCALSLANDAATQLALNADSLRLYLKSWEREWKRLAQSLRNAAAAYEEVDEAAADSISNASSRSGGGDSMAVFCDPDEDVYIPVPTPPPPPPPPPSYPYYEVRQAVYDIEAPDQGAAFLAFARDWDAYQRRLQNTANLFRPFEYWEGAAQTAVEGNFEMQRSYVYSMVTLCSQVATQANTVVAAHRWALTEHPKPYDVEYCDARWRQFSADPQYHQYLPQVMSWYAALQTKSEEVLAEYLRRGSMPLSAVNPKNPPPATRIDPPPKPPPKPGDPDYEGPDDPDDEVPDGPDDGLPDDGLPDEDELPEIPTNPAGSGTPSVPPSGIPAMDDSTLKGALEDLKSSGAGVGSGMKPASVGGVGGGGGMPSVPLQPAVGPEAAHGGGGAAAGGRDLANLAKAAGSGGAGGPMGMPMGGAGAGAGGQGGEGKSKRVQGTEESLYTEERQWTEGIIGRRRKDPSDGKDTK